MKIETVEEWKLRTKQEPKKCSYADSYKKKFTYTGAGKMFKDYTKSSKKKNVDLDV